MKRKVATMNTGPLINDIEKGLGAKKGKGGRSSLTLVNQKGLRGSGKGEAGDCDFKVFNSRKPARVNGKRQVKGNGRKRKAKRDHQRIGLKVGKESIIRKGELKA